MKYVLLSVFVVNVQGWRAQGCRSAGRSAEMQGCMGCKGPVVRGYSDAGVPGCMGCRGTVVLVEGCMDAEAPARRSARCRGACVLGCRGAGVDGAQWCASAQGCRDTWVYFTGLCVLITLTYLPYHTILEFPDGNSHIVWYGQ